MHSNTGPSAVVRIDAGGAAADLVTLDALARIQLIARRHHIEVRVENASEELRDLAAFAGLEDVLLR